MPDNPVAMNSNEREFGIEIPAVPQGTHEPGFTILPECLKVYFKNGGDIFRGFGADSKGIHPVFLGGWVDKEGVRIRQHHPVKNGLCVKKSFSFS